MNALERLRSMLDKASRRETPTDALPQGELRFVIELAPEQMPGKLEQILHECLGPRAVLRPIPGVHGFHVLRFPDLDRTLPAGALFDLAYGLRDALGVVGVEPEMGSPFYSSAPEEDDVGATEAVRILDALCWADESAPTDRQWSLSVAKVQQAWELSTGAGVRIAHLDTGVAEHIDLDDTRVDHLSGADFVLGNKPGGLDPLPQGGGNPGHGLATASVAISGRRAQVNGVAPSATLVPIRCIEDVKVFNGAPVAAAIAHARSIGANVITMSLGGVPSRAVHRAIGDAIAEGMVVVAAAGNCVGIVVWPARYPEVISVAGSNILGTGWKGSSRGEKVDIAAPAQHVWHAHRTKVEDGTDGIFPGQGTSFATAMVAGVAALWLDHHGMAELAAFARQNGRTVQDLFRAALRRSANAKPLWPQHSFGPGVIDARACLDIELSELLFEEPQRDVGEVALPYLQEEVGAGLPDLDFDYSGFSQELAWIGIAQAWEGRPVSLMESANKTPATRPSFALSERARASSDDRLSDFSEVPGMTSLHQPMMSSEVGHPSLPTPTILASGEASAEDLDRIERTIATSKLSGTERRTLMNATARATGTAQGGTASATDRYLLEAVVEIKDRPALRVLRNAVDWRDPQAGSWGELIYLMSQEEAFGASLASVGRIDARGIHVGTGFLIAPGMLMTNRHVVQEFAAPIPTHDRPVAWEMLEDVWVDFAESPSPDVSDLRFRIRSVAWSGSRRIDRRRIDLRHPDVAILELEATSATGSSLPAPVCVSAEPHGTQLMDLFLVGYPAKPFDAQGLPAPGLDPEIVSLVNKLFDKHYGCKYFSPGKVKTHGRIEDGLGALLMHDALTLGGSSGSCAFRHNDAFEAFALHFGGKTRQHNFAQSIAELVRDHGLPADLLRCR